MYPAIPIWDQVYNWDWLSDENLPIATLKVIDERKIIVTEPYMLFNMSNPDDIELRDILVGWFENFINPNDIPDEPMSDMMFPIMNIIDHIDDEKGLWGENQQMNNNNMTALSSNEAPTTNSSIMTSRTTPIEVVGAIRTPFYWRDTIRHILPDGNDGIIVVFHNPCTQSFTYQIK
jgi:hypothetical protein